MGCAYCYLQAFDLESSFSERLRRSNKLYNVTGSAGEDDLVMKRMVGESLFCDVRQENNQVQRVCPHARI